MSYQTTPVVTATSVTYAFVQDLVLGFGGSLTASRELAAFDPLTVTMRWTVSKCASSAGLRPPSTPSVCPSLEKQFSRVFRCSCLS